MKQTDQLLAEIKSQLEALPDFSQAQFTIKKHVGMFNDTDMVKMTSFKFDGTERTIKATTMLFELIKAVDASKEPGNLTFSLTFGKEGVDRIQVQDFRKLS